MNHPPQDDDRLFDQLAATLLARCDLIAQCTETPGRITRTFCSNAMRDLHATLCAWMETEGLNCRVDAAGNFFGRWESPLRAGAPALLIGSHLDSVPNAGKYDGVLGVVLGMALIEAVQQRKLQLPFALEVVGFSEEEGVRYGFPFIGSLALVGACDQRLLAAADTKDVSVAGALRSFGCNPDDITSAERCRGDYLAYLEPHIEQGPVLELENQPLGVVTAIAGQTRALAHFMGKAGHAGTVPMAHRRDALTPAAEWIVQVERIGLQTQGLVATVGAVTVHPGASNVIPEEALLTLDVRHTDDAVRESAVKHLQQVGSELAAARGLRFELSILHEHSAVAMDSSLTDLLQQSVSDLKYQPLALPSGAGHDAAVMARRWPTAMLFIRCADGISHHPNEYVSRADVTAALTAMWHFVQRLAATTR